MKFFSFTASLLLFSGLIFTADAKPLTPQEALSRIEHSSSARKIRASKSALTLAFTLADSEAQPALYVFSATGDQGFVIAGADDLAFPVLGYSDSGTFDAANIPPALKYWLSEYSSQIARARKAGFRAAETNPDEGLEGMEAVGPLIDSKWNQGSPYNKYCFEISADNTQSQSVTGCVATAMAQVMYYFKYPEIGHGEISYTHGDSGTYQMDFASQAFDWKNMLPVYSPGSYSAEEADAVAYLMKACGYSVKMDYGKGESGANGAEIPGALINYFGYNENIQLQTRAYYTYSEWMTMIYDNLKNVGPVVYDGSALDGGHSFVCDGYDGNGYFHINWGWGGMSDGYYLLDALNPDEFGIGGAAGGYNLGQQVILNITPDAGQALTPALMQFGNATGKISDGKLSLSLDASDRPGFQYINPAPITLTFGVKVENLTSPDQQPQYVMSDKKDLKAEQSSFFTWDEDGTVIDLASLDLTEGDEYSVTISTLITLNSTSEWVPVVPVPGKSNYVIVTKTASGYEVKNSAVGNLSVSNFEILSSPVYWNMPVKFSADFANDSADQLTRNYSAVFFNSDGKECYKMENYSISVDAGQSLSDSWTSINWYKENGAADVTEATTFTVKLYDNWLGQYVDGVEQTVTVEPEAPKAKVESSMSILNGEKDGDVYIIEGDELQVAVTVKVTEGLFNHTLMLALQAPMANGDYETVMHKHFDAIPNLSAGEEATYEMTVQIDDIDTDKTYRVEIWGPDGGFNEEALVKFKLKADGIQALAPNAEGLYTVFDLSGKCLGVFSTPDFLPSLPAGLYIINGSKLLLP